MPRSAQHGNLRISSRPPLRRALAFLVLLAPLVVSAATLLAAEKPPNPKVQTLLRRMTLEEKLRRSSMARATPRNWARRVIGPGCRA